MSAAPVVSVVVPTYQRRETMERLVQALGHQTLEAAAFELVAIVDGSTDGTTEMLRELRAPFHLQIASRNNHGRAAARNHGIQLARAEVLVFLDDDMQPAPECLAAHLRAHASTSRLAVIGAAPVALARDADPVQSYVGTKFNRHLATLAQAGRTFSARDFYSGNFSIRRGLMLEVGGFDQEFRIYGNEDVELSLRLRQAGVELVYEPHALALQTYDKGFRGLTADTLAKGRTSVLLARKHPGAWSQLRLSTFDRGPRSIRLIRRILLSASTRWPWLDRYLFDWTERYLRSRLPGSSVWLSLALDQAYWQGVRAELRSASDLDGRLANLAGRLHAR